MYVYGNNTKDVSTWGKVEYNDNGEWKPICASTI